MSMKLKISKQKWTIVLAVAAVAAIGLAALSPWRKPLSEAGAAIYVADVKDLKISVLESGSVKALKAQEIKCEVEGQTTVISLIPEGTVITEEDVKNQRVLVELNSADLRDRIVGEEISLQSVEASFTQAKESYDIQLNQNESNIKTGELTAKFAKIDLEKYLGAELTARVLEVTSSGGSFADLIAPDNLGMGEGKQALSKLQSDIDLAKEEVLQAEKNLGWTQKLWESKFVTDTDLKADELTLKRQKAAAEQAQTALDIFIQYELPKQIERKLADHSEAFKELERIRARARSEKAKAEADKKSKEAAYLLQTDRFGRLQKQLAACVIKATTPGLVVYATSGNPWQRQPPLEEGASVREKQVMITLPDTSTMAVEVKVHEAAIDRVKKEQKARITLDAYPDLKFEGHVVKRDILPDAQNRWMNPDLKVYNTIVAIEGQNPVLKPGLSAKVEIMVDELKDVLVVPIQAVVPKGDEKMCYVLAKGERQARIVQTGAANDQFLQITSGLAAGDKVLLNPPRYGEEGEQQGQTAEAAEKAANGEGQPAGDQPRDDQRRAGPQNERPQPDLAADQPAEKVDQKPEAGAEKPSERRQRLADMSPEEREKLSKELESLSPEERAKRIQGTSGGRGRRGTDAPPREERAE